MKLKNLFLAASMVAAVFCSACLYAEEITLSNLYAVMPLDNSKDTGYTGEGDHINYIIARFEGNAVKVDFKKPTGNVQAIIRDHNGRVIHNQSRKNPGSLHISMQGKPAGRYMLEVYTDKSAVGGAFEVK